MKVVPWLLPPSVMVVLVATAGTTPNAKTAADSTVSLYSLVRIPFLPSGFRAQKWSNNMVEVPRTPFFRMGQA
jgi:hypothetical protein